MEGRGWLRRYVLRRDVARKVRTRAEQAHRRLTRSEFGDAARLLAHRRVETVLDVGANIGYVTADLLRTYPAATVHAFEPTPETFAALERYIGDAPRVRLHQCAVGERVGSVTFHADNRTLGGGANSLLEHDAHFRASQPSSDYREVEVAMTTLDAHCATHAIDHVDLVKLDIEGAEGRAIEGASALLGASAVDLVASEVRIQGDFVGGPLLGDIVELMARHDYRLFGVYDFAETDLGQSRWGNALFLAPGFRRELTDVHGAERCGFAD